MDPALALCRLAPASRPPAVPLREPLRFTGAQQPVLPWTVVPDATADEPPLDPERRHVATSLMAALVEVLSGRRPVIQLELWVEPELLDLLEHLHRARDGDRLRLRSVRVQAPHEKALEVSAHLRHGDAARAAALRISRRNGRWVATHLALALDPPVIHRAGWVNPLGD